MDYDLLEDLPDLIDDWTNNDFLSFLKKISLEDLTDMFSILINHLLYILNEKLCRK